MSSGHLSEALLPPPDEASGSELEPSPGARCCCLESLDPEKQQRRRRRLLIAVIFAGMFLYGLTENAKIVIYPEIKLVYSLTGTQQGILVALCSCFYTVSTATATWALTRWGSKLTTVIGFSLLAAGSLLNATLSHLPAVYVSFALMDLGFGAIEVSVNAVATGLFQERPALWIALMHFCFGVGSITAPYAAAVSQSLTGWGYHSIYVVIASLSAPLLLSLSLIGFRLDGVKSTAELISMRDCFRNPMLKYFCFCMGFMLLLELGSCDWSVTYLVDNYNLDPFKEGALFSTLYFLSYTVGRLSVGILAERFGYFRSLWVLITLCFTLMVGGFLIGRSGFYMLAASGLPIGLHWPILIAIGSVYYGDDGPIFTDLFIVSGAIFNTCVEFLIGLINDYIGTEWGYRCLSAAPAILFVAVTILYFKSRKTPYCPESEFLTYPEEEEEGGGPLKPPRSAV